MNSKLIRSIKIFWIKLGKLFFFAYIYILSSKWLYEHLDINKKIILINT